MAYGNNQQNIFQRLLGSFPRTGSDWANTLGRAGASMAFGPLGGLAFSQMGNPFSSSSSLNQGIRGFGDSVGRMFDNNPNTGFFNNPTAAWNWGQPGNWERGFMENNAAFSGPPAPNSSYWSSGDGSSDGGTGESSGGGGGGGGFGGTLRNYRPWTLINAK